MSEPRHISASLGVLVAGFDGETLRHLASIADARDRPRFRDSAHAAEEIAAMVERGDVPTIGWWKRHTMPRPRPAPVRIGRFLAPAPAERPAPPAVYVRTVLAMLAAGYSRHVAADCVSQLALEDGLDPVDVAEIVAEALEELVAA
jgi:hypothetical protein